MGQSGRPKRPSNNKLHSRRSNTKEHRWEEPAASGSAQVYNTGVDSYAQEAPTASDPTQVYYGTGVDSYAPEAPSIPRGMDLAQDLEGLDINDTNGAIDVSETADDFHGGASGATAPEYTHQEKGKEKYKAVEDDVIYADGYNTTYPAAGTDSEPTISWSPYGSTDTGYNYPNEQDEYGNGIAEQAGLATDENDAYEDGEMPGTSNPSDPPDSGTYQVVPGSYFQPGEVFKTIWSTPRGVNLAPHSPEPTERQTGDDPEFYTGPRRFVVVATDEGNHSTCVPIFTYGRKGCKKKGLKPQAHGIVYSKPGKPRKLSDEPELGFKPVAVNMYGELEKLDKASRVNYSKLTDIDHNVPVIFIGHIDPKDWYIVSDAVNERWESKKKEPSSRSKHHSSRKRH
ncbi:putative DUF6590 domain-containing protein [Seiridium unicorne]|uniref:DUF6590 domain-containing protein n=1 Tax=Seiridium unicorne TaxID=138068 RepID=A0ABR2V5D5_9PEZI